MAPKFLVAAVAVILAVTASTSAQQPQHFLDLTSVPRAAGFLEPPAAGTVPLERRMGPGGINVTFDGPNLISPFTMTATLLTMDKSSYHSREPFVYEVELRNTGNHPVPFPRSPDSSLFDKTLPDGTFVSLGLADVNDPRSTGEICWVFLYGSASVPGSLETILPGETIHIRVGSDWMGESRGRERLQVVMNPTLAGIAYDDIKSDNTITVEALGR